MKAFTLAVAMLLLYSIGLFAQSGMTIQGGGAVTVNGNTFIVPAVFVCGSPMIDSRDNQVYSTVQIGSQCWMKENLNYGIRIDGTSDQTNNSIIEKYCYNDDENNCNIYGGLYQWDEAMTYSTTEGIQGVCPTGWHIPTDTEWTILTTYLGGLSVAGGKMKEAGTAHWASPNTGATNSSGFTAIPGSGRDVDGNFLYLTYYALFWSSSFDATNPWSRYLYHYYEIVTRTSQSFKTYGLSVRCLKN